MATITLGSDAQHVQIGSVGLGLMNLTWNRNPVPDEQAFATLTAALENGSNFWNAGTFYSGSEEEMWNLSLLKRYFTKYPDAANKVVLSVKGGFTPFYDRSNPDSSVEALRKELDVVIQTLGGTKEIDIFEPARRDRKLSPHEIMTNLKTLQQQGYFKYIGLSEVNAETIRAAASVAPIAAVEVEFSPFCLDITENGVLQACNELGIAVVAYAPLAGGLLGGRIRSVKDIPEGDERHNLPRYYPENFDANLRLADSIHEAAAREGLATPDLVFAWLRRQGPRILVLPGATRPQTAEANAFAVRSSISDDTYQILNEQIYQLAKQVSGTRYTEAGMASVGGLSSSDECIVLVFGQQC